MKNLEDKYGEDHGGGASPEYYKEKGYDGLNGVVYGTVSFTANTEIKKRKQKVSPNLLHGWWREPWTLPVILYKKAKYFYQRGKYGYADCDLWGLDYYLYTWMPSALREMREDQWNTCCEEGDLDKMIRGFEAAEEQDDPFNAERWEELEKERVEGMNEFVEHFSSLWL